MSNTRSLLAITLFCVLVPLTSAQWTPAPPGSPTTPQPCCGGSYTGPGDVVPPPCTGPSCPPPPPPDNCPEPCCGPLTDASCFTCQVPIAPTTLNFPVVWNAAPECFQGEVVRLYNITIGDIKAASMVSPSDTLSLCIDSLCPVGVDSLFIYTTIPFRHYRDGVPTSDGGNLDLCGMCFEAHVLYADGHCSQLGGVHHLSNDHTEHLGCGDVDSLTISLDQNCFFPILATYQSLGLYSPFFQNYYLNDNSIVFTVLMKCCGPDGEPDCP